MERIIACLEKIDNEYETRSKNLKNKISKSLKVIPEPIEERYFLLNFIQLKKHAKKIDDIDTEFYDKLNLLHDSWMDDYNRVYSFCINKERKSLFFKKKLSSYDYDKLQAYCDDLEITKNSIKKVIKEMRTSISFLQIQEFLK